MEQEKRRFRNPFVQSIISAHDSHQGMWTPVSFIPPNLKPFSLLLSCNPKPQIAYSSWNISFQLDHTNHLNDDGDDDYSDEQNIF